MQRKEGFGTLPFDSLVKKLTTNVFLFFNLIISNAYAKIMHCPPSKEVSIFTTDLSYIAIGSLIAAIFSFSFNILAGRALGPSSYGEFVLIQSIAMFLYIPMNFGINSAMIRYVSEIDDFEKRSDIISTAYILVFVFTIISLIIYYLLSSQIFEVFDIQVNIFNISMIFAVLFVFNIITTDTLRCLHQMKSFSITLVIGNILLFFSFILAILNGFRSSGIMVFSTYIYYISTGLIVVLYFSKKYIKLRFDGHYAKILIRYGLFALLSGVSYVSYTNLDKLFINKYLSEADLGLYNAYYFSSIYLINMLMSIFITVFFPTASRMKDKTNISKSINKFIIYLFIIGTPFLFISEYVLLRLFGSAYLIDIPLMLFFVITSIIIAWYGIYAWLLNSQGLKGAKLTFMSTGGIALVSAGLNMQLIPRYGLFGAIGSIASAYFIGLFIIYVNKSRISWIATKE